MYRVLVRYMYVDCTTRLYGSDPHGWEVPLGVVGGGVTHILHIEVDYWRSKYMLTSGGYG